MAPRTKPLAPAVALIEEELSRRGWSQNELARRLGVVSGQVSYWVNGLRRPGLDLAVRLEEVLGIAPRAWVRPADARAPRSAAVRASEAPHEADRSAELARIAEAIVTFCARAVRASEAPHEVEGARPPVPPTHEPSACPSCGASGALAGG